MRQKLLLLVLALAGLGCAAEEKKVAFPETPAGRRAAEMIAAVNTGDEKQIRAFLDKWLADKSELEDDVNQLTAIYRQTGGIQVDEAQAANENQVRMGAHARNGKLKFRMMLGVAKDKPEFIEGWGVRGDAPNPASFFPKLDAGATQEQRIASITEALDKAAAAGLFSGTFAIAKNGETLVAKAYGLADRNFDVPNKLNTRFHIGSMPKMFTSVAIAQLAQAGKLKYEDPIAKYLPDYPNQEAAQKITIHHLLTHTSGLGDYFGAKFDEKKASIRKLEDYYQFFASKPLLFEPGARFSYSNAGMHLAGLVVQRASGMDYYEYLKKHVFAPAGMMDTDSDWVADITPNLARGYTRFGGPDALGLAPPSRDNVWSLPPRGGPAGGGYSTAGDLLKFAQALTSGKLIGKEYVERITTGKVTAFGNEKYGYGFQDAQVAGQRKIGHGGGAPGMNAMLSILPESGWAVAILSNYDPPFAQMFHERAVEMLVKP